MKVQDSRRLTGPNLQSQEAGAIVEVGFEPHDAPDDLIARWRKQIQFISEYLPFPIIRIKVRRYRGGAALFIEAPIDALYSACEVNDWAVQAVMCDQQGASADDLQVTLDRIEEIYIEEVSPQMTCLIREAQSRGLPYLWDDDEFSIGYGRYSRTYRRELLPHIDDVPWTELDSVPVILVTGTNGKTTTARILSRILHVAGHTVGNSSTDGIQLNGAVLETGDWTGPGAARAILRHPDIDAAVLETARGGLLRRGVGVHLCDAAIVTNIADDHLGEYGILNLTDLAMVKGLVYGVVKQDGVRVINMDDIHSSALAGLHGSKTIWIFQNEPAEWPSHRMQGGMAIHIHDGHVCFSHGKQTESVAALVDIPVARQGAALHDISNVLSATALAISVGIEPTSIATALKQFGRSWNDNPGRGQRTELDGVHILMDFAHNPHGVAALLGSAQAELAEDARISVAVSQAGDRSEEAIREMARAIAKVRPYRTYIRDLPDEYQRGRTPEATRALFHGYLTEFGLSETSIGSAKNEVDALEQALTWANKGDLIVHMVHLERDAIARRLTELGAHLN